MSDQIQPDSVRIPVNRKSKDGKIRVWMPESKDAAGRTVPAGYRKMYSVNAREAIAYGGASLEAPSDAKARKAAQKANAGNVRSSAASAADKKSADEMQAIIDDEELDLDLSQFEKIGEKRDALAQALIAKEEESRDDE